MFERFTEDARKAMSVANQEAQRYHHKYIGTEHVLLASSIRIMRAAVQEIRSEQMMDLSMALCF